MSTMADDIDIEEHDVLDHPKIQNIFPDLSLVKSEVMDAVDEFPYEDYAGFNAAVAIKLEPGTSYSHTSNFVQPNKIILGSKPSLVQMYDSSQQLTLADLGDPDIDAFVLVDNIGPDLERSSCYCEKCQTLFATVNALDAHKMTAHSFLVAVGSNNRAIKSTAKRQGAQQEGFTFCNHCNNTFPDNATLIKHLYNVMTLKSDETSAVFNTENENTLHRKVHSENQKLVYRCSVCKCFFGKELYFKTHVMSNHKINEAKIDLKKCMFEEKCFFCPGLFGNVRSYKSHVSKHHTKFFFKDESKIPPKITQVLSKKMQIAPKMPPAIVKPAAAVETNTDNERTITKNPFKCLLCNMEIKYILYHKKKFHPKLHISNIPIQKINSDYGKSVSESRLTPSGMGGAYRYKYTLTQVPKSVLFKCPTCEVHFLAAYIINAHSRSCKPEASKVFFPQCSVSDCNRKFRECDLAFHEIQHKVTKTFVVIVLIPRISANILNKCGKCGCLLNDKDFGAHMAECDGVPSEVDCEYCNLHIHSKSHRVHMKRHMLKKIIPKKIKIIEYMLISEIKNQLPKPVALKKKLSSDASVAVAPKQVNLKRKLPSDAVGPVPKQVKVTAKVKLFVCKHCQCVMPTTKPLRQHRERRCVEMKKIICRHCGLLVTIRSSPLHYTLHTNDGLGLKDFCFVDLFTFALMPPPITRLPYCAECDVSFGTFLSFRLHNCATAVPSKLCKDCNLYIETRFYNNHLELHEVHNGFSDDKKIVESEEEEEEKDIVEELPELLKKYESLKSTWNILYKCQCCEIFTDSYDVAVEHSQRHFSSLQSYGVILEECQICKFTFQQDCFRKHVELHKTTRVNKNTFNILMYNFRNLHSRTWFEMFEDFSDDQIRQIVSMSMYEHTRSVKVELEKEGSKAGTLYKCATCKAAVSPSELRRHVDRDDCLKPLHTKLMLECATCVISFTSQKMYVQHCIHHGGDARPLRVLLFNKPEDEDFNMAMTASAANEENYRFTSDSNTKKIVKPMPEVKKMAPAAMSSKKSNAVNVKGKLFYFFRCKKCNSSLTDRNKLHKHVCTRRLLKCIHCGLHLFMNLFKKHVAFHKSNKTFNRNNFKVTDFTINNMGKVKFYETKQLSVTPASTVPTKKKTYARNYAKPTNTLYKCSGCNVCFLCDTSLMRHMALGLTRESVTCDQCGVRFNTQDTLNRHKVHHHELSKLNVSDIRFVIRNCGRPNKFKIPKTYKAKKETATLNSTPNVIRPKITLYKCFMCPVLFESMRSLEHHMRKTLDVHNVPRTPCTHCGLIFSRKAIANHRSYHEKHKLTAADFVVKTNMVMRCNACSLNFHYSSTFRKHIEKSLCTDSSCEKEKCDVCETDYLKSDLQRHRELFHTVLNLKIDDITFVTKLETVDNNTFVEQDLHSDLQSKGYPSKELEEMCIENEDETSSTVEHDTEINACDVQQNTSTIYKCYDCSLHFVTPEHLSNHFKFKSKYNIEELQATCNLCNIDFAKGDMAEHVRLHHTEQQLSAKDFTIKEMYILYKCSCQIYFHRLRSLRIHIDSNHGLQRNKVNCSDCNYTFSSCNIRRHFKLFHVDRDVKREDFTIIIDKSVRKALLAKPRLPTLKSTDTVTKYEAKVRPTNSEVSSISKIKQNEQVAKKYEAKVRPTNSEVSSISKIKQNEQVAEEIDKDVLAKTIYKCFECGLHFLSPELVVSHFESKSKYYLDRIKADCEVCNIEFTRDGLAEHQVLHHNNLKLNKDDFIVKEIYILYECSCLMNFHHVRSLIDHLEHNHINQRGKVKCEHCDYTFSCMSIKRHLKIFHKDRNVKREDFTILINDISSTQVMIPTRCESISPVEKYVSDSSLIDLSTEISPNMNNSLASNQEISKIEENKASVAEEVTNDTTSTTIFKCYECSCHFVTLALLIAHFETISKYNLEETKATCAICNTDFTSDGLAYHQQLHHENLKLNRDDFTVKEIFILYECSCKLCYHQPRSLKCHVNSNHGFQRSTAQCSYCDYTFSMTNLRRHVKMFHEDRNVRREDFTILGPNSQLSLMKSELPALKSNGTDEKSDVSVMDTSGGSSKLNTSTSTTSPTNTKYKLKLYKCKPCNVNFLSQNSCYRHAHKHEPMDPKEYIECKMCNLQFSCMSLSTHVRKHHIQQEYQPEDILVEEYLPSNGLTSPKINIYYLKDRLQSELVSTTSEIVKDAVVSTDTEKQVTVTAEDESKDRKLPELVTADSSETDELEFTKGDSPKVYKRKSKDESEQQTTSLKTQTVMLSDSCVTKDSSVDDSSGSSYKDNVKTDVPMPEAENNEKNEFSCELCEETFKTNRALEFHINLDHIDEYENCAICNASLNKSILTRMHLASVGNNFKCCICKLTFRNDDLQNHALLHR